MDWLLYGRDFRHEKINGSWKIIPQQTSTENQGI